jgi:hypothetical protein
MDCIPLSDPGNDASRARDPVLPQWLLRQTRVFFVYSSIVENERIAEIWSAYGLCSMKFAL